MYARLRVEHGIRDIAPVVAGSVEIDNTLLDVLGVDFSSRGRRYDEMLEVLPGLGTPKYEPIPVVTFHTRTTAKFYGDDYAVEVPTA